MDVNEHGRLSNFTLWSQIKVKEQHFYCCFTFNHSSVFKNEHNSYPKMSVK